LHGLSGLLSLWQPTNAGHDVRKMNLLEAAVGTRLVLERVPRSEVPRLIVHGLYVGRELVVEQDAPFGGPRLVRVGRRRLSVPRSVAATLTVRTEADEVG